MHNASVENGMQIALARVVADPAASQMLEDISQMQSALLARVGAELASVASAITDACQPSADHSLSEDSSSIPLMPTQTLRSLAHMVEEPLSEAMNLSIGADNSSTDSTASQILDTISRRITAHSVERVICVGDLHGNLIQLRALWSALADKLGPFVLSVSTVIFLGDYCDRGPDTRGVIDWLIALKASHRAPVYFLAGNHDFGLAAFLGSLPVSTSRPPMELESTRKASWTSGFWPHEVPGGMHYQGRRWAEGSVFDSEATFRSYGVHFDRTMPCSLRDDLLRAVPSSHIEFLSQLEWAVDLHVGEGENESRWEGIRRIICVHAGLEPSKALDLQMHALRQRDLADEVLHEASDAARMPAMTGREAVLPMHPELGDEALLISGHHGISQAHAGMRRIILDRSGGKPSALEQHPLEALVLPERIVIGHDHSERQLTVDELGYNTKVNRAKRKADKEARIMAT